jgi:uroporphyrinogen decarboxylase
MTSRERILAAINHEPVDRLPVDFGGTRQSGIAALAYRRLREHLGADTARPVRVFDLFQMLAEIEPAVAARVGADCLPLYRPAVAFGIRNERWQRFRFSPELEAEVPGDFHPRRAADGSLIIERDGATLAVMPEGGFYFDRLEAYPGATHPDLDGWEPPRLSSADLAHLAAEADRLCSSTDKAVIVPLGPPYELFYGLGQGGFDSWMVTFASEPGYVQHLYRKLTDVWLENLEALHGAVGDRVQILQIADDFGTQRAPFLSVRAFRELVLPAYRRGLDWIHQRTSWKVMLHSDGALYPLLPSIIEMGVDILNPVQTTAAGMDPRRLKAEFGHRLVFWGGTCDSQGTLGSGSPADVAAETAANLAALAPGSGYVCAPVHNVQANVPPANVLALFDTAVNWRVNSSASA